MSEHSFPKDPLEELLESGIAKKYEDYSGPFAKYYDDVWDNAGDDLEFYLQQTQAGESIVELGAGTGRLAIPLADAGRHIIAVDLATDMLAQLESRMQPNHKIQLVKTDITTFKPEQPVDVVIVPINTIYHLKTRQDRQKLFESIAASLKSGGRLYLHYTLPEREDRHLNYWIGTADQTPQGQQIFLNSAEFDPDSRINQFRIVHLDLKKDGTYSCAYTNTEEYHPPVPEIKTLLLESGLKLEAIYADFDKTPFREAKRRHEAIFVGHKS